jgi:hypothetical protein
MHTEQAPTPAGQPLPPTSAQRDGRAPAIPRKPRGNPNLNLSPRCGARTRAGCPCRAPAIRGKLRCRMHGGRSTGPRTAEGRARIAAARTIHGRYSAEWRARNRRILSIARRSRVFRAALHCRDRLPPELAARFRQDPPEFRISPYRAGGITPAEDRAMQRAEKEALAPWKAAIALLGCPRGRTPARAAGADISHAPIPTEAHAPEAAPWRRHGAEPMPTNAAPKPRAPEAAAPAPRLPRPSAASPAQQRNQVPGRPFGPTSRPALTPAAAEPRPGPAPAVACGSLGAPEPHATEPGPDIPAPRPAAPGDAGQEPAKPHAPDGQSARHTKRHGAAAAIAKRARKPLAPVKAAAPRTDNAAIRRAAAQWRAKQSRLGWT